VSAPGPVVVLGGSGLLGAALVRELRRRGAPHAAPSRGDLDLGGIASIEGRLRAMSPSALVNASGFTDVAAAERPGNRAEVFLLNRDVPAELARVASVLAVPFIHVSTDYVFDGDLGRPYEETDAPNPVQVYGESKLEGERLVQQAQAMGLRAAIVRLSNVYGGRADHPDRAVPALMQRALNGDVIDITGGDHYFDFVHVDDVARALLDVCQLLHEGSEDIPPMHLTTGIATSLSELAQLAVTVAGSASMVREVPARAFDVQGFCGDPGRAAQVLGWKPRISLREGIAMVANDLRRNGPLASAGPFEHLR